MPENKKYYFSQKLELHQSEELQKKVWYLSDYLVDFSLIYDDSTCVGINYTIPIDAEDDFIRYLNYVIENDIHKLKDLPLTVLWEKNNCDSFHFDSVKKHIYENEIMNMIGEGQLVLNSPLIELYWFFDMLFRELSCQVFLSQQYQFPTLLGTNTLKKAGYFDSFPNLWMSIFRMKNNYIAFREAKQSLNSNDFNIEDKIKILEYSLPPTMCYYVYNMLSGKEIRNQSITAVGKSFRFENKYCNEMGRLWDFTIRETVFLGEAQYVEDCVDQYRKNLCHMVETLGLSGVCQYANDPFFLSDNNTTRINVQKMKHVKAELRLNLSKQHDLAVASFNKHGTFLGKRFNITLENEKGYATTGCIGIGLERFLIGFLCQYGYNSEGWPAVIRENYKDLSNYKRVFFKLIE